MSDIQGIRVALQSLKRTIHDLEKLNYSIGKVRGVYAELYVADKLAKFSPQIGKKRKVKNADIYLTKKAKRVEVKESEKGKMTGDADFCWVIQSKQLEQKKFDYCVMVGFDKSLEITKEFIFTYEDFEKEPRHKNDFMPNSAGIRPAGICYYGRGYTGEMTTLERKLKEHPANYERRWDRIK